MSVSILIFDDNNVECEESFLGNLILFSTVLNVTVAPDDAEIFIQDNDSKHFCKSLYFLLI